MMKEKIVLSVIGFCLTLHALTGMVFAGRVQLELSKESINAFGARSDSCYGMTSIEGDEDYKDLRTKIQDYYCQGRFSLSFDGPKEKLVTLFARFDFAKDRGFLVVRKGDAKKVWILDLGSFPEGKWTHVPAEGDYGAYDVFYHPGEMFERKIASIKWGKWWEGPKPR